MNEAGPEDKSATAPGDTGPSFPPSSDFPAVAILDSITEGVSILDSEWRYQYVNTHGEVLTGLRRQQMLGRTVWELFPATIGTEFETRAREAMREQKQTSFEYFFETYQRWYENRFYPTPRGLMFLTSDIDDRKRLAERVEKTEKSHRDLFDATQDGVMIVNDEGVYVDVNASLCRFLKASREELVGSHFSRFIPPARLAEAIEAFSDLKEGKPSRIEFPLRAVDGTEVDFEWASSAHYLPGLSFCMCRNISERRRNEAALAASEERQRRAVQAGKVGLWEWDIPANSVNWSEFIYELHGIDSAAFNGTVESFAALVDPRDQDRVSSCLSRALAGEAAYEAEYRPVRPDGTTKWLRTNGGVTFGSDGQPLRMLGSLTDVTSIKLAEEEQLEVKRQLMLLIEASGALLASPRSEEVLRRIVELARKFVVADAHSVWRKDAHGFWQLASAHGLSPDFVRAGGISSTGLAVPSKPLIFEDVPSDTRLGENAGRLIREGVKSMLLVPLTVHDEPDGTLVFYWRSRHLVTGAEARIAGALGNLIASALRTAELYDQQLRLRSDAEASQRQATFLAESGAVLASSLDYEATLKSVTELAVPVFADWAAVDIVAEGKLQRVAIAHTDPSRIPLVEEFTRQYPPRDQDLSMVVLRSGKSALVEEIPDARLVELARDAYHLELIRKMGFTSVIVAPMKVGERVVGLVTFVTAKSGRRYSALHLQTAEELARRGAMALENAHLFRESQAARTELVKKNDELKRANEDLNQFAYSASHDLQEPLRMVAIYSQLLDQKYGPQLDVQASEFLGYCLQGARRMEALLRDILAYTQIASAEGQRIEKVESSEALDRALANLDETVRSTHAVIEQGPLPEVRTVGIHMVQLFQNLIGNAIKYRSERPPLIRIAAEPDSGMVRFSVQDNGIGIDPRYKDRVFGLFKRLHNAQQYSGTGVGLALCQKIVQRYGGKIWLESVPGEGTTFYFTVPAGD